jgi:CRISPR-associated protein Cas2
MADSQRGLYVIAYDIANPRRLARIHRFLKKQGLPVQYSVFTVAIKRKALLRLLHNLKRWIIENEDDIRCYRLPQENDISTLGRQFFPGDVFLFSNGVNLLLPTTPPLKPQRHESPYPLAG